MPSLAAHDEHRSDAPYYRQAATTRSPTFGEWARAARQSVANASREVSGRRYIKAGELAVEALELRTVTSDFVP
jgi:hypothetical protein